MTPHAAPRLAKSTLTLIPLLGTHEVIFAFVMDEHARGTLRFVKLLTELSFTSFQVPRARPSRSVPARAGGRMAPVPGRWAAEARRKAVLAQCHVVGAGCEVSPGVPMLRTVFSVNTLDKKPSRM